jgi:hypothetical protein
MNTLSVLFICYEKMIDLFVFIFWIFWGVTYFGFGTILVNCAHCCQSKYMHVHICEQKVKKLLYIDTVCPVCIALN